MTRPPSAASFEAMASQLSEAARTIVRELLEAHYDRLVETAITFAQQDLADTRHEEESAALVRETFRAWRRFLVERDYGLLESFVTGVAHRCGSLGHQISSSQRGLLAFKKAIRPHLDALEPAARLDVVEGIDSVCERVLYDLSDAFQGEIVRQQMHLTQRAEAAREAQTAFLADIGHEVRTPLSSLLGFVDLIERSSGSASPEETGAYLLDLRDNARGLLNLVDDVVDLARLEAGRVHASPEDLDLWRLVEDVHRDVQARTNKQVGSFTRALPAHLPRYARLDGGKFARALRCVLRAAARLSPDEGEVHLTVTMPTPDRIVARITEQGEELLAVRRSWFEGLHQPSGRRGAGPGLAIAVARRLAGLMGGDLEVEGAPGGFTWRLWIAVAPLSELTTTAPPALPARSPLEHVLVVTGPETPEDILQEVFQDAGIGCAFVREGSRDVERRPDVVLADSPEGYDELSAHPHLEGVPWVAASADPSQEREDLLRAGAYEVLDKPLDIDDLVSALLSAAARPPLIE